MASLPTLCTNCRAMVLALAVVHVLVFTFFAVNVASVSDCLEGKVQMKSGALRAVSHQYASHHAQVHYTTRTPFSSLWSESSALSVFHITDSHVSLHDEHPGHTTRMFRAMAHTVDRISHMPTTPREEFVRLLQMACQRKVDLIALGGDILNFPTQEGVAWVLEQLEGPGCGIPFMYTAGNHDWHEEYLDADRPYDSQRLPQLQSTLRPLFDRSVAPQQQLYGHARIKGVDVLFVDNSNHQVNEEQLAFVQRHLDRGTLAPALILMHMPLPLPGLDLPPKKCCGHPNWGADSDELWVMEGRSRWPEEGNLRSTGDFLKLVQAEATPSGRLVALLTGHVHEDFTNKIGGGSSHLPADKHTTLACDREQEGCSLGFVELEQDTGSASGKERLQGANGCIQYTSLDGAEGGHRLLVLRHNTTGSER